jgi:hypothetical protein
VQSSYVASPKTSTKPSFLHLSPNLAAVILFSLLGLVVSAALISYQIAGDLGTIIAHLN